MCMRRLLVFSRPSINVWSGLMDVFVSRFFLSVDLQHSGSQRSPFFLSVLAQRAHEGGLQRDPAQEGGGFLPVQLLLPDAGEDGAAVRLRPLLQVW